MKAVNTLLFIVALLAGPGHAQQPAAATTGAPGATAASEKTVAAAAVAGPRATDAPAPRLLTLDAAALSLTAQRLRANDATAQVAFTALKTRADKALLTPPRSVTHKSALPPSGDKHDYISMGPYWWPNPNTPNGLPYVQRDGQRNPEVAGNAMDSIRMQQMLADARDLALAHHFTQDARYAQRAALVIRTWFLDPATRMNPHLKYAQGVPGIAEGRGIGLIDTRDLWWAIDAAALVHSALSLAEHRALRAWFSEYAQWLDSSQLGRDAAAAENNHGMFYDVQMAVYWLYTGQTERARRLLFEAQTQRFAAQIAPDGSLPLELARTRPYHYHTFTLEAMTRMARYAEVLPSLPSPPSQTSLPSLPSRPDGQSQWTATDPRCQPPALHLNCPLDLWGRVIDGRSLRGVLDFVAAVAIEPRTWRHATRLEPQPLLAPAVPVLLMAQRAYPPRSFDAALQALKDVAPHDAARLLWPVP